ncbi:MAG: hypothetical protein ACRBB0_12415 [Pelagimonas sp.]|uniref:hypothetical protein n=1 Tax=Pelagimonas sp. TaxID=2073170 RepID=UPI003D6BB88B
MVPNFALSLSFEGIALLRRTGDVWAQIQEVPLDGGDLEAAVLGLRNRAEDLDPAGAQVTLVIPNEQIRYLDVEDLGGDASAQDVAVRTALDGATPYPVDELVYDFAVHNGRIFIAAVARETLDEAEDFARQNGFEPVGHAAIAPDGQFDGAVFFGPAGSWSGSAPERLPNTIAIVPANDAALLPLAAVSLEDEGNGWPEQDDDTDQEPEVDQHQDAQPDIQQPEADEAETPAVAVEPDAEPEIAPTQLSAQQQELDFAEPATDVVIAPEGDAPSDTALQADPDAHEDTGDQSDEPELIAAESLEKRQDSQLDHTDAQAASKDQLPQAENSLAENSLAEAPLAEVPLAQDFDLIEERDFVSDKEPDAELSEPITETLVEPAESETPPPAMSFSTIRATRDGSDMPAPLKDRTVETQERPAAQVKPRFTPVATRDTAVKEAGVTSARLDTEDAKLGSPVAAPKVAPAPMSPKAPSAPVRTTPQDQADAAPSTAPALARLAALRARSDKPVQDNKDADGAAPDVVPQPSKAASAKGRGALAGLAAARQTKTTQEPAVSAPEQPEAVPEKSGKSALGRIAALRAKPKTETADPTLAETAAASLTSQSERDRLTVFGARNHAQIGGKPRFLGLLLTAGLLLFMAGVAAWASVFLDDGLAGLFGTDPDEPAIAVAPEIAPEGVATPEIPTLRPSDEPKEEDADIQLAALDLGPTTDAPKPRSLPIVPQMLSPEEAAATYAATGIWQRAPVAPHGLPEDNVDNIYVASIDPAVQEADAIALPSPSALAQEPLLEPQRLPPPAGQVFDMDSRGLVRATPQGALSPDGVRVFAGLPPVIPPQRSVAAAPQAADPVPPINQALSKLRPRLRPENLVETRERAVLSGISRSELAAIRPVMRPKTVQEEAVVQEPDAPATDRAVTSSLAPIGRPRDMAAIVRRAERSAAAAPSNEPVQTAAIAPRTVTPAAPTSRGVAQSATVRNAINLNKISLIGVYGTPANRRALVRLPNGKYKKVKVGDRLDGGRVAAIGDGDLRYTKSGRNLTLKMPRS